MPPRVLFALAVSLYLCGIPSIFGVPAALTVMAKSGSDGLLTIDANIAVNREGIIAFTGTDSTGSRVFVVSSPHQIVPILPAATGHTVAGVGTLAERIQRLCTVIWFLDLPMF
jgi:hypothetical protein